MTYLDYFSFSAKKAINRAAEYAKQMRQRYVDPEHILFAILKQTSCTAVKVLTSLNVNIPQLQFKIENHLYKNSGNYKYKPEFSIRTIDLLENAFKEMRRFQHQEIGTTHILIAMAQDRSYFIQALFRDYRLDQQILRQTFSSYLEGYRRRSGSRPQRSASSSTSVLDKFARDLTKLAAEGKLDPVIGREREIERLMHILSKRTKNNPVLVGEPGVGKTAIVEGLAERIVKNQVPPALRNKRVLAIDMASLVAGTKFRGEFEERLKLLIQEIRDSKGEIIIFIDELHTILGAGSAEGSLDASNILKPSLARGELHCIGATTFKEYRKYIEKDGALSRRFQAIMVEEPSFEETVQILEGLRSEYEKFHNVVITDEALHRAVYLSQKYITDRKLPDKAIDVIDEASASVHLQAQLEQERLMKMSESPPMLEEAGDEEVAELLGEQAPPATEELARRFEEQGLMSQPAQEEGSGASARSGEVRRVVTEHEVARVVEMWTGVPVTEVARSDLVLIERLEEEIKQEIIGQDRAVETLVRALRRSYAGIRDMSKPIGSFIFLGPTGVGKTELARVLARKLFLNEDSFIKIDMSEYSERFAVSRLIGSPPGYVGYDEGGQLTEAVRRHPYSVVLFDELEKAHPDVFNTLLQLLDEGVLTDGQGRKVYFNNTVVIFTTNIGGQYMEEAEAIGFRTLEVDPDEDLESRYRSYREQAERLLKKFFRTEFLNRIDEIVYFNALRREDILRITELAIGELRERLKQIDLDLEITPKAVEYIAECGFSPVYGARNLKRTVVRLVEDPISERIIRGELEAGKKVKVKKSSSGEGLVIEVVDGRRPTEEERERVSVE